MGGICVTGGLHLVLRHPQDLLGHIVGVAQAEADTGGGLGNLDTAGGIVGVLHHTERDEGSPSGVS